MKLTKLIAPLVIILLMAACKTSDKLALQLNYQKGKKYYYTTVTSQKMNQEIMGKVVDIDNTTTIGYIYEVKDINKEGNYMVTITYDKYDVENRGTTDTLSSKMDKGEIMKGFTYDMVVTPKGKVLEVHGMEKLMDKAFDKAIPDSMKDSESAKIMDPIVDKIKSEFSDKKMGDMMEQMTNYFPDDAVEVGDTWERVVNNSTIIPMKITTKYKVTDVKDNIVTLDVKATFEPGDGAGMMGAMGMKMNFEGDQKGTMQIDTKTGLLVKSMQDMDMKTTITVMGMTTPGMKIKQQISMEAKEMQ